MADFGILQMPNFAGAALQGYQAGRQIGRERRTEAALKGFQVDPEGAIAQAYAVDPALGDSLTARHERAQTRAAMKDVIDPTTGAVNNTALSRLWQINPAQAKGVAEFARTADKDKLERAAAHGEIKAQAANYLAGVPLADRPAALQRIAPQMIAQGFTAEELSQARFDDASLEADQAFGMSLKEQLAAQKDRWVPVGEGGILRIDARGNPVGQGNPYAAPRPTSPAPPAAEPTASSPFSVTGVEGDKVTSGTRSPERNKRVGGVANSYHLTGQAEDRVPPPGMSMAAYHAELKRLNPNKDVINEGDHVHLEPRGPNKMKPSDHADLKAQAQAAIAAGADPAAVNARLAQMGVK